MDRTATPYEMTKSALYDGKVRIPEHTKLLRELQTRKIDHPVRGSKDIADALAGVVYGLTRRRELWVRHEVPQYEVPVSLTAILQQDCN